MLAVTGMAECSQSQSSAGHWRMEPSQSPLPTPSPRWYYTTWPWIRHCRKWAFPLKKWNCYSRKEIFPGGTKSVQLLTERLRACCIIENTFRILLTTTPLHQHSSIRTPPVPICGPPDREWSPGGYNAFVLWSTIRQLYIGKRGGGELGIRKMVSVGAGDKEFEAGEREKSSTETPNNTC